MQVSSDFWSKLEESSEKNEEKLVNLVFLLSEETLFIMGQNWGTLVHLWFLNVFKTSFKPFGNKIYSKKIKQRSKDYLTVYLNILIFAKHYK